jgi:hypothetical protein
LFGTLPIFVSSVGPNANGVWKAPIVRAATCLPFNASVSTVFTGILDQHMDMENSNSLQRTQLTAAIIPAAGQVTISNSVLRQPSPGEVRIQLEGCGVCASNLTPWAGPEWMEFPTEPGDLGHEGWGRIDAVGEGIDDFKVGDRVAALSYNAYASHDFATTDRVVRLPSALDGKPFPGEPLGCAMNIFKRAEIREGQTDAACGQRWGQGHRDFPPFRTAGDGKASWRIACDHHG